MYLDLIQRGWTLYHIDEMDVHFFFDLNRYAQERETKPNTPIDQIPGF